MIGCTRAFRLWKVMWDCHTSQKDKAAMRALQLENGDVFVDVLMENVRKYVQYLQNEIRAGKYPNRSCAPRWRFIKPASVDEELFWCFIKPASVDEEPFCTLQRPTFVPAPVALHEEEEEIEA